MANFGTLVADGNTVSDIKGAISTGVSNTLYLGGTFGGGTVKLQLSPDGTTWYDVPSASWTAATVFTFHHRWAGIRLNLAGSAGPALTFAFL